MERSKMMLMLTKHELASGGIPDYFSAPLKFDTISLLSRGLPILLTVLSGHLPINCFIISGWLVGQDDE